jgi:hypothetical protein
MDVNEFYRSVAMEWNGSRKQIFGSHVSRNNRVLYDRGIHGRNAVQCASVRGCVGLHIIIMADLGDLEDRDRLPGNSAAGVRPRRCY